MKTHFLVACCFLFMMAIVSGQKGILKVMTDKDTLSAGDVLTYEVTLENTQGKIQLPDFSGFRIVGGPYSQSSFSSVNGIVTQSASHKVILSPVRTGLLTIEAPFVKAAEDDFAGQKVQVFVKDDAVLGDKQLSDKSSAIENDPPRPKNQKRILKKI